MPCVGVLVRLSAVAGLNVKHSHKVRVFYTVQFLQLSLTTWLKSQIIYETYPYLLDKPFWDIYETI